MVKHTEEMLQLPTPEGADCTCDSCFKGWYSQKVAFLIRSQAHWGLSLLEGAPFSRKGGDEGERFTKESLADMPPFLFAFTFPPEGHTRAFFKGYMICFKHIVSCKNHPPILGIIETLSEDDDKKQWNQFLDQGGKVEWALLYCLHQVKQSWKTLLETYFDKIQSYPLCNNDYKLTMATNGLFMRSNEPVTDREVEDKFIFQHGKVCKAMKKSGFKDDAPLRKDNKTESKFKCRHKTRTLNPKGLCERCYYRTEGFQIGEIDFQNLSTSNAANSARRVPKRSTEPSTSTKKTKKHKSGADDSESEASPPRRKQKEETNRKDKHKETDDHQEYQVEKIIDRRPLKDKKGSYEYKLKWKGYDEISWEPEDSLSCPDILRQFKAQMKHNDAEKSNKKRSTSETREKGSEDGEKTKDEQQESDTPEPKKRKGRGRDNKRTIKDSNEEVDEKKDEENNEETEDDDNKEPTEQEVIEPPVGFEYGDVVDKIAGAAKSELEGVSFFVSWVGKSEKTFIPAKIAYEKIPQIVLKYYEANLKFH